MVRHSIGSLIETCLNRISRWLLVAGLFLMQQTRQKTRIKRPVRTPAKMRICSRFIISLVGSSTQLEKDIFCLSKWTQKVLPSTMSPLNTKRLSTPGGRVSESCTPSVKKVSPSSSQAPRKGASGYETAMSLKIRVRFAQISQIIDIGYFMKASSPEVEC